jgi:hypothetical protein
MAAERTNAKTKYSDNGASCSNSSMSVYHQQNKEISHSKNSCPYLPLRLHFYHYQNLTCSSLPLAVTLFIFKLQLNYDLFPGGLMPNVFPSLYKPTISRLSHAYITLQEFITLMDCFTDWLHGCLKSSNIV